MSFTRDRASETKRETELFSAYWWLLAVRGLFGLLFGGAAFLTTGSDLSLLIFLFAVYMLLDSAVAMMGTLLAANRAEPWPALAVESIADFAAAIALFSLPEHSVALMVYITGAWAIISGGALLVASTHVEAGRGLLALAAFVSMTLGFELISSHRAVAAAIANWMGIYALTFGLSLLALGFRLRPRTGRIRHQAPGSNPGENGCSIRDLESRRNFG